MFYYLTYRKSCFATLMFVSAFFGWYIGDCAASETLNTNSIAELSLAARVGVIKFNEDAKSQIGSKHHRIELRVDSRSRKYICTELSRRNIGWHNGWSGWLQFYGVAPNPDMSTSLVSFRPNFCVRSQNHLISNSFADIGEMHAPSDLSCSLAKVWPFKTHDPHERSLLHLHDFQLVLQGFGPLYRLVPGLISENGQPDSGNSGDVVRHRFKDTPHPPSPFVHFGTALFLWIGGVVLLYAAERRRLLLVPAVILMISSVLIAWHLYASTEVDNHSEAVRFLTDATDISAQSGTANKEAG